MRFFKVILCVVIMMTGLTACSSSDLQDYQNAVVETEQISQGEMEIRLAVDVTYDEEGMTFEEKRDISYYENIDLVVRSQFDESEDSFVIKADTYYSIGGLGLDITMFMNEKEMLIKVPMLDKYIVADTGNPMMNEETYNEQGAVIKRLVDEWNAVLEEEDVFSGKKDYVMTDKGQLKTTTYTININDQQFQTLKNAFFDIMMEEGVAELFMNNMSQEDAGTFNSDTLVQKVEEILGNIRLSDFEAVAYVDFDGRIAKQVIKTDLVNDTTEKGDVKVVHLEYEITYDNLGIDPMIEFPKISEEDILKANELVDIESIIY